MIYQLRKIETVVLGLYSVTFEDIDTGAIMATRCTVVNIDGIIGVQPEPDIFMNTTIPARAVSAAVVAFDRAVRGEEGNLVAH